MTIAKVLDYWLYLDGKNALCTIDVPNEEHLWFGGLGQPTVPKTRFPIFQGNESKVEAALVRDLHGRVARYRQLHLGQRDTEYAILMDVKELCDKGFPLRFIAKAWWQLGTKDDFFQHGINAFRRIRNIEKDMPRQKPNPAQKIPIKLFDELRGFLPSQMG